MTERRNGADGLRNESDSVVDFFSKGFLPLLRFAPGLNRFCGCLVYTTTTTTTATAHILHPQATTNLLFLPNERVSRFLSTVVPIASERDERDADLETSGIATTWMRYQKKSLPRELARVRVRTGRAKIVLPHWMSLETNHSEDLAVTIIDPSSANRDRSEAALTARLYHILPNHTVPRTIRTY